MAYFIPNGFALINGEWERIPATDYTEDLTPENARRYAETTDKLCFCADLTGHSVDSRITARFEDQLEALAIELGYIVVRS
jgi:hypothetical protein